MEVDRSCSVYGTKPKPTRGIILGTKREKKQRTAKGNMAENSGEGTFNNGKSKIRGHGRITETEREKDEILYRHFWSTGHRGLEDMKIQLIDRVNGEGVLRDKEGQWAYN
ncbi:hypothetical protein ACROYT_G015007 [Oculina patagonica]